jgi:hypothetical protein
LHPVSFAWFTPSFYAPGLGFLMFAVGVNLQLKAFAKVFKTPKVTTFLLTKCPKLFVHFVCDKPGLVRQWCFSFSPAKTDLNITM